MNSEPPVGQGLGGASYSVAWRDARPVVTGTSCLRCGARFPFEPRECRACRGELVVTEFGPEGTVWAGTVVRIGAAGRATAYALAYVDLADGPRVLAHVETSGPPRRIPAGRQALLSGVNDFGDLLVECP